MLGLPYVVTYVLLLEGMSSFLTKIDLFYENAKKCPNVLFFGIMHSESMSNHSYTKICEKFLFKVNYAAGLPDRSDQIKPDEKNKESNNFTIHHVHRCQIFRPKSSEEQKKGHRILRCQTFYPKSSESKKKKLSRSQTRSLSQNFPKFLCKHNSTCFPQMKKSQKNAQKAK